MAHGSTGRGQGGILTGQRGQDRGQGATMAQWGEGKARGAWGGDGATGTGELRGVGRLWGRGKMGLGWGDCDPTMAGDRTLDV